MGDLGRDRRFRVGKKQKERLKICFRLLTNFYGNDFLMSKAPYELEELTANLLTQDTPQALELWEKYLKERCYYVETEKDSSNSRSKEV